MISFVQGDLVFKTMESPRGAYFTVNLNGMGLDVLSSSRSVASSGAVGDPITLFTTLVVREDAMTLVGFNSHEERDLFAILQSASGVGTKVSLALLTALSVSDIAQAIVSGNFKTLTVAKGVGPKLAQKMTVDLKEKMTNWRKNAMSTSGLKPDSQSASVAQGEWLEAVTEAESVLLSLGYLEDEIQRCFTSVLGEGKPASLQADVSSEALLREALKWMAQTV